MKKTSEKNKNVNQLIALLNEGIENQYNRKIMCKLCYKIHILYDNFEDTDTLPILNDDLLEYIEKGYDDYVKGETSRQAKLGRALRNVLIGIVSSIVLAAALQVIAYTFGYDLFKEISEWGKQVLFLPDGITEEGNITINKVSGGDGLHKFSTMEEMQSAIEINILYPAYLPEDTVLEHILYMASGDGIDIVYHTEDLSVGFLISSDVRLPDDTMEPTNIGGYDCYISHHDLYQADFAAENPEGEVYQYTISHADYEQLVKIIENLKYEDDEHGSR